MCSEFARSVGGRVIQQSSHSSPSGSLSPSSSLATRTTPSPTFSFNTRPACWSLLQKAFRTPPFVLIFHICNVPFDPPAAIVSGSSGDHTALKTFPYANVNGRTWYKVTEHTIPRSLDVTRLTCLCLPSSLIFQTFTTLSVPPVTRHPRICGLTSSADTAPS
jgi:hypothetical protein